MNCKRLFKAALCFAAISLAACGGTDKNQHNNGGGGGDGAGGGAGGGGGTTVTQPELIHGTATAIFQTATAEQQEPIDLHSVFVSAIQPKADGSFETVTGTSTKDGKFAVAAPVNGNYWLRIFDGDSRQDQYLLTDKSSIDLPIDVAGRPDSVAASIGTQVLVNQMSGMNPWEDGDGLGYVSANLGVSLPLPLWPSPGETNLSGNIPWDFWALPDKDKGDDGMIVQYHYAQDPTTSAWYAYVVKAATLAPFTVADGQVTTVTGAFTTPPALDYTLAWNRSAFANYKTQINPNAGNVDSEQVRVVAMPGGAKHGVLTAFPPDVLLVDQSAFGTETSDISWTFSVTNPYPADWIVNRYAMSFPVNLPVPGDPNQIGPSIEAVIGVETQEMPSANKPVVPMITPAKALKIAGKDATQDQSKVGLTPKFSWTAPDVGTPTSYFINVYRWEGLANPTAGLVPQAILVVPGDVTEIQIPPGVFENGRTYVMNIEARMREGEDVRSHAAYRQFLPYGWADAVTANISP